MFITAKHTLLRHINRNQMDKVKSDLQKESHRENRIFILNAAIRENNEEMCLWLLDETPTQDLNLIDTEYGMTPLHMSILNQNEKLVGLILLRKVNVEIKSKDGKDAYDYAMQVKNPRIMKMLSNYESKYFCVIV